MRTIPDPHFGYTQHGLPVHARTVDHHPDKNAYQRFNKRIALWLTRNVGTMTCFWVFLLMTLTVLPSVLYQMNIISKHSIVPVFMLTFGFELLATWLLSTCFQLILLPGLMVGQNLQNEAADVRAAKSFEDTELIVDRLDTHTQGGITEILNQLAILNSIIARLNHDDHQPAPAPAPVSPPPR